MSGTTASEPEEEGSVGATALAIAEDVLRWLLLKVALGVAALTALAGLAAESPPAPLRVAAVVVGVGAFGWAITEAVRSRTTRARQWTFILAVLLVCGAILAVAMLARP